MIDNLATCDGTDRNDCDTETSTLDMTVLIAKENVNVNVNVQYLSMCQSCKKELRRLCHEV